MELYYITAIVDRDKGKEMSELCRSLGLNLNLTKLGRGTATEEHLSLYGLEAKEKTIVSTIADGEKRKALFKAAKRKLYIDIPGNGIILAIPLKSVAGGKTLAYLSHNMKTEGTPAMEFEHELIIVILNEGYSDAVMEAARQAGAAGGTVLHAKGTRAAKSDVFFGVSLADEKDVIYIVADSDEKSAIMQSISEKTGTHTKAGAICFSLPISAVAGLRAKEKDE